MNKELEVGDLIMFDGVDIGLITRKPYQMFRGPIVVDVVWSGKTEASILDCCAYENGAVKIISNAR